MAFRIEGSPVDGHPMLIRLDKVCMLLAEEGCTLLMRRRMAGEAVGIRFQRDVLEVLDAHARDRSVSRSDAVDALLRGVLGLPDKKVAMSAMGQDQVSGMTANAFGRQMGRTIAAALGAEPLTNNGNEFSLDGNRVAIKCAKAKTTSVGVTHTMLDRLSEVIGAFETATGAYDLYALPAARFRECMRATRSTGPSAGKVGLVSRSVFLSEGRFIRSLTPKAVRPNFMR
ncbi:hypothetical protein [Azospirillum brasilense]|uniref:hypothetical protein n=1 Tax=Azospirillum brasilense TaxID=192 RepID=UPI000E0BDFDF|nr:hypothetical protein [Azospirillum brasilense]